MEFSFIAHISKEKEGTYFSLPFSVSFDSDFLSVSYSYDKKEGKNCIDLGLEDPDGRFLGWSGSNKSEIRVSATNSTPGYVMTNIKEGEWGVLAGAYHIEECGVDVEYRVKYGKEENLTLKCDLHMHSTASDGEFTIPELAERAKKLGLDVISVTDHNNWAENLSLPKIPGITIIPGVEWTHYKGHMNFWGPKEAFSSFIANNKEEMEKVVNDAKSRGALVSVNHPKCTLCPYKWDNDDIFDTVEVWNGPMRRVNENGIKYFTYLLKKGRKVALVGGSDYHRRKGVVKMGNPTTVVNVENRKEETILSSVREGRSYVTESPKGPFLSLDCKGKSFGEHVDTDNSVDFIASASSLKSFSFLEVVFSNGKKIRTKGKDGKAEIRDKADKNTWFYLRTFITLPGMKEWTTSISNPIWID
ncbi:MAG: CehA/McbA family metallohydrolase [Candidatus Ornithospirochaeta sp.]